VTGYPTFQSAWEGWYLDESDRQEIDKLRIEKGQMPLDTPLAYQDANLKSQQDLLDSTYGEYVKGNTDSEIVATWTAEMDKAGNTPPHKRMEHFLFLKAFKIKFSHDIWDERGRVKELYDIVTRAPRCPDMMFFIRVVRNDTRLPQFWFKFKNKREMEPGDSVMLPVSMSTSNIDIEQSWFNQGPYSAAAEVDNIDIIKPTVFGGEGPDGYRRGAARCRGV
jgi:hypothetical protein